MIIIVPTYSNQINMKKLTNLSNKKLHNFQILPKYLIDHKNIEKIKLKKLGWNLWKFNKTYEIHEFDKNQRSPSKVMVNNIKGIKLFIIF